MIPQGVDAWPQLLTTESTDAMAMLQARSGSEVEAKGVEHEDVVLVVSK